MRPPRAFSYLRFSNAVQERGDSVRRQVAKSKKWSDDNGVPLDDSLSLADCGVSAFLGKNTLEGSAFREFLNAVENSRVLPGDYLIVESLDRISRNQLSVAQILVNNILAAGVNIVTLVPERVFTKAGSNDIGQAIEIIIHLARGYEESRIKSVRVSDAWEKKREHAVDGPVSSRCPSWLVRSGNRFEFIEERKAVVLRIFNMAECVGVGCIAKTLHREGIPTFRADEENRKKKTRWRTSTIRRILTDRTALGEYQPHKLVAGKRVPVGRPIHDYYLKVVDEDQFNRVQTALQSRKGSGGAATKKISNLFTSLLFDRKGEPFVFSESNPGERYLRTPTSSMPYDLFEATMMLWANDLDFESVVPVDRKSVINQIAQFADKLAMLDRQVDELKQRIKSSGEGGVLYDLLMEIDTDRRETATKLDAAKLEASSSATDALVTIKEILAKVDDVDGDNRVLFRGRLRRHLRRIVKQIVVASRPAIYGGYYVLAEVTLANDVKRTFGIKGTMARFSDHHFDVEVPNAFRCEDEHTRCFDLESVNPELCKYRNRNDLFSEICNLGKAGLPLDSIAAQCGVSITTVSRTLVRHGLRRLTMKPKDHPHTMNWHPQGRGWVKQSNGHRYFVGCGTLREMYPQLVSGDGCTDSETWLAANQWWDEHVMGQSASA